MLTVELIPHWGKPYHREVARITKNWIIVILNEVATQKFSRKDGYRPRTFRDSWIPTRLSAESLRKINEFAESQGGTWNSGWKPAKKT